MSEPNLQEKLKADRGRCSCVITLMLLRGGVQVPKERSVGDTSEENQSFSDSSRAWERRSVRPQRLIAEDPMHYDTRRKKKK